MGRPMWRARTVVPNSMKVVLPLTRSAHLGDGWASTHPFGNRRNAARNVEEDPVHERPAWCIRVVDDQRERGRSRRRTAPRQRWRPITAVAGERCRYGIAAPKPGARERDRRRQLTRIRALARRARTRDHGSEDQRVPFGHWLHAFSTSSATRPSVASRSKKLPRFPLVNTAITIGPVGCGAYMMPTSLPSCGGQSPVLWAMPTR